MRPFPLARIRRSVVKPPIFPGTPVFGMALPSYDTVPKVCPLFVSTTQWQSTPAVNPGPTPITKGASVILVPRFFLARMASTTTSGLYSCAISALSSTIIGMSPSCITALTSSIECTRIPVISSTSACPS
ncbi:hypothetical protein CDFC105_03861 [Clostridioides difficile]|nr:hypothetical protein CDFC105_03861 [Clostridioides difficile]